MPRDPPGMNNFHQVPIGALYAAAQLEQDEIDVSFFDLRIEQESDATYSKIGAADLAVVFSADYDLAQCYPPLSAARDCITSIRRNANTLVACAGSHATAHDPLTREFTKADIIIRGEFEFALPELVRCIRSENRKPKTWPPSGIRIGSDNELSRLPSPAYRLARMQDYFSEGFVSNQLDRVNSGLILGNRGCPYACNFCYLFFGQRLRKRPVDLTVAELKQMYEIYSFRHFFFLDYTFTIDNSWVQRLCASIIASGMRVSWICQTRVDCINEKTLLRMKEAGCSGIWLGVESPELNQRAYLTKGRITGSQIENAISLIRRCGLIPLVFVIVGLPNETETTLQSLNEWLDKSHVYYSLSIFQRRLGTPLGSVEGPIDLANGWGYLERPSQFLGESSLLRSEIEWFFDYHRRSGTRMANVMQRRLTESPRSVI